MPASRDSVLNVSAHARPTHCLVCCSRLFPMPMCPSWILSRISDLTKKGITILSRCPVSGTLRGPTRFRRAGGERSTGQTVSWMRSALPSRHPAAVARSPTSRPATWRLWNLWVCALRLRRSGASSGLHRYVLHHPSSSPAPSTHTNQSAPWCARWHHSPPCFGVLLHLRE